MASPSPLDRCWIVKDSPGSLPIMPAVRAAVERHWPDTQRAAASVLGDEALAAEIMEGAIEQAVAYLADHPPEDQEDVSAVLSRFCRQEVGRRRKERKPFVFIDFSGAPEASRPYSHISAVDAAIDAERILADAPPKVREAHDDAIRQLRVLERRGGQNGYQPGSHTKEMQKVSRPYPTRIGNSGYSAVNSGKGTSRDREGFRGRASVVFRG